MKHIAFLLIVLFAAAVVAQDKPPVKEAAKPEATKEVAKSAWEAKKQAAAGPRRAGKRWHEDARHCLERPTNTEIIKCAEGYL
jgi:hypothetical protein